MNARPDGPVEAVVVPQAGSRCGQPRYREPRAGTAGRPHRPLPLQTAEPRPTAACGVYWYQLARPEVGEKPTFYCREVCEMADQNRGCHTKSAGNRRTGRDERRHRNCRCSTAGRRRAGFCAFLRQTAGRTRATANLLRSRWAPSWTSRTWCRAPGTPRSRSPVSNASHQTS